MIDNTNDRREKYDVDLNSMIADIGAVEWRCVREFDFNCDTDDDNNDLDE